MGSPLTAKDVVDQGVDTAHLVLVLEATRDLGLPQQHPRLGNVAEVPHTQRGHVDELERVLQVTFGLVQGHHRSALA